MFDKCGTKSLYKIIPPKYKTQIPPPPSRFTLLHPGCWLKLFEEFRLVQPDCPVRIYIGDGASESISPKPHQEIMHTL